MGPGIVIPVIIIVVAAPLGFVWARKRFKESTEELDHEPISPGGRLTSSALRELSSPPWRVVYEIAPHRLDGVEHVAIGPPGVFAIVTSMEPVPAPPSEPADPHVIAEAAVLRGALDDALRRCAMSSDRLVTVHWGVHDDPVPALGVDTVPGATAIDGRQLEQWASSVEPRPLSQAQIDLAWQTVVTAIGRPDPLN